MVNKPKGKVGIMTFHWAANYGAVLQAWALQKYIQEMGYDVEIINYVPSNHKISFHRCLMTKHIKTVKNRYKEYKKEQLIKGFRVKHIKVSSTEYSNKLDMIKTPPIYDYYISGSDQIWNPSFTMNGQKGVTLSYYLDFVPNGKRRIAFSSSFGCSSLDENVGKIIVPELKKFYAISTREAEGTQIVQNLGLSACNTVDPTVLLEATHYEQLIRNLDKKSNSVYVYMLHGQRNIARDVIIYIKKEMRASVCYDDELSVEEWLEHIHNAKFVITNSFHCVVFCLMFHIPFISIDVKGMDMSSRITTLLRSVGLEYRFCKLPISLAEISDIITTAICWEDVDSRLNEERQYAKDYLHHSLEKIDHIDDVPSSQCTGCGLCSIVCPKSCISMVEDNFGYIVPSIDKSRCVNCGMCVRKCIVLHKPLMEKSPIGIYDCWNTDGEIIRRSSSGGVFTALAETVIEENGLVYGAKYAAPLQVKHAVAENASELGKLRGSKYQPSEAWHVFEDIKKQTAAGRRVLFVGTPCQVAAIKEFVGKADSLICVDVACHGIPSLKILREKCNSVASAKVSQIDFRDKRTGWKDYSCVYYANDGREISHEIVSESDFMKGYIENLYIRESCEDCRFAMIPRVGDISLADCWIKVHDGTDKEDKGITDVLISSEKGKELFQKTERKLHVEEAELNHVLKGTPTLAQGSRSSKQRAAFWNYYRRYGYKKAMRKFFGVAIAKRKLLRLVKE